jgi:hypothetical protein
MQHWLVHRYVIDLRAYGKGCLFFESRGKVSVELERQRRRMLQKVASDTFVTQSLRFVT